MITMKNMTIEGNPVLKKIGQKIKLPLGKSDKQIAQKMLDFIKNSQDEKIRKKYNLREAVGLAAPQINLSKQMFAVHFKDFTGIEHSFVAINPTILKKSKEIVYLPDGEGCLSVLRETPGQLTPRHERIDVHYWQYDPYNDILEETTTYFENYPAIVFQHEYDHINGIVYVDKMFPEIKNGINVFEKYDLDFEC